MQAYLLGALVFLLCIAVFIFQNSFGIQVHFITWNSPEVSVGIVVLIAACAGAIITFLLDSFRYFKIARTIKDLRKQNLELGDQVKKLSIKNKELEIELNRKAAPPQEAQE